MVSDDASQRRMDHVPKENIVCEKSRCEDILSGLTATRVLLAWKGTGQEKSEYSGGCAPVPVNKIVQSGGFREIEINFCAQTVEIAVRCRFLHAKEFESFFPGQKPVKKGWKMTPSKPELCRRSYHIRQMWSRYVHWSYFYFRLILWCCRMSVVCEMCCFIHMRKITRKICIMCIVRSVPQLCMQNAFWMHN